MPRSSVTMLFVAMMVAAAAAGLLGADRVEASEPLRQAASRGDAPAVSRLIAAGARLDEKDAQGRTALLLAVAAGHDDAALALIAAGADIDAVATNRDTPWLLAGARGRTRMLQAMWPRGPNLALRNRFGGTALIPACHYDHVETVRFLLTTTIDVNHVNDLGWTCLMEIVLLTDGGALAQENTRQVLAAGADPNIADRDGISPLAHATRRGLPEVARIIAARGGK
jgi:ankyrin repeat protein